MLFSGKVNREQGDSTGEFADELLGDVVEEVIGTG